MDWTWSKVFSLALVRSGILGRGQVASAGMQADAIDMANLLLDELDGQGLALPVIETGVTFNTVAGQAVYTLGTGGDSPIRPEQILTATLTIATGPVQRIALTETPFTAYTLLPIPSNQSMPYTWSLNPKWPTADFYLYPNPNAVYPVVLNCKVKWSDTIVTPDINPFAIASVPSGFAAYLVIGIALKLAQRYRLQTQDLANEAASAKYTLMQKVYTDYRSSMGEVGIGVWSDTLLKTGLNP